MLVNFNHTKTIIIELIYNRLNTGRFSSTTVTKQQGIICLTATYKGMRVIHQFLLLDFISYKFIECYSIHIIDSLKTDATRRIFLDTECLIHTKHSNTIIFIKSGNHLEKLFLIGSLFQFLTKRTHFFTDILVIHQFFFHNCLIIRNL